MALVVKDRVKETSVTDGTGSVTLAGAVANFQSFSSVLSNADTTYYAISHRNANEWEVGLGTYNTGVLARTTILESSNAGSAVSFSSGTKDVFITYPAEKSIYLDGSNLIANSTALMNTIFANDGTGSTLDADLLDGQQGTYYTGYTDTAIANLIDTAPSTLDTLNELAAALGDDPNFATTVTNSIATKLPLAGGTMTGNIVMGTNTITDAKVGQWDIAYGWGNHGAVGYLTSYTETDPIYTASSWYTTTNNAANWNTAYGWGNHASGGYLTSYTETDPIYVASSWYTTTNNSGNWNTAYGWGNHASGGYLTAVPAEYLTETEGDARYDLAGTAVALAIALG